ncbi:uncharacterized protein DS421_14g488210 [Arachis hypogaea]|nr:uncharacterized protein DS421_14g488210 [Arachis hypogaea]
MEDHRHRRQPLLPLPSSAPGEDAVDGEKSSAAAALAAAAAAGRMKKPSVKSKSGPKTAWRKLLSQCSQVGSSL